jgi:branched-chain amino acid transport system ATP-binding protein
VSSDLILETRSLEKRFGGVRALASVSFGIERGELRCLIGPNGAGKSTFFKLLTGQIQPTAGSILFEGEDITDAAPHEIGRLGIGIKNQVQDVFNGLSVAENLYLAASPTRARRQATGHARALAARLGLEDLLDAPVGTLAHGQRQWVEIAMVVARAPKLVLLDEPSAGMTSEETRRTAELIREVNRTASLIVVEHDMQFIRQIAHKVTVFHQGGILLEDSFARVVADPVVRDVYLGRRSAAS